MRECGDFFMIGNWIIGLEYLIGLVIGFFCMFYMGWISNQYRNSEELNEYKVKYRQEQLEKQYYKNEHDKIYTVLENLDEDEIKEISNDNWNHIILKKKECEVDDWIVDGHGNYMPIFNRLH